MAITEGGTTLPTDSAGKAAMGALNSALSAFYFLVIELASRALFVSLRDSVGTAIQQDGAVGHKVIGTSEYGRVALAGDTPVQIATQVAVGHSVISASNAAATLSLIAAGANKSNYIGGISVGFSAAPTSSNPIATILDGASNVVWAMAMPGAGPYSFSFPKAKRGTVNTAMSVTLSAGGTGIFGYINADPWTD